MLSNRSTDWWKTLRVWGDLLQKQQWDPLRTRLALITTATAAPGSHHVAGWTMPPARPLRP